MKVQAAAALRASEPFLLIFIAHPFILPSHSASTTAKKSHSPFAESSFIQILGNYQNLQKSWFHQL